MEKELKTLQLFYAGVLADSVYHFNEAGILGMVTQKKLEKQNLTASSQLRQLGISNPEELFTFFSKVFGCIQWELKEGEQQTVAKGNHCLLCSIAKNMKTTQPCFLYCINPFRAMLKAMSPSYKLEVGKTLWNGDQCVFNLVKD